MPQSAREAVNAYLCAMSNRDLAATDRFLTNETIVIMPNGARISGRDDIYAMHEDWFSDMDWSMDLNVQSIDADDQCCHALIEVFYHDVDENSEPYELHYYLFLLMKRVVDRWILVHDQNTIIR